MDRESLGIAGLDKILGGGIPKETLVLVTGSAGSGKSILGMQYLAEGVKKKKKCLYVGFDSADGGIHAQAAQFGWEFEKYEKSGLLKVLTFNMAEVHVIAVITELERLARSFKPDRVVFDSISVISMYAEVMASAEVKQAMGSVSKDSMREEVVIRGTIMGLLSRLRHLNATTLVISELPEGGGGLSRDTYSEFICDGVIRLVRNEATGKRLATVSKMRLTDHDFIAHTFQIEDKKGIVFG